MDGAVEGADRRHRAEQYRQKGIQAGTRQCENVWWYVHLGMYYLHRSKAAYQRTEARRANCVM